LLRIPTISTEHLLIRDFSPNDAEDWRPIVREGFDADYSAEGAREHLMQQVGMTELLASIGQPPYGDRAILLRETSQLIGSVGLVPSLIPWGVFPEHRAPGTPPNTFTMPEFGLYWVILKSHRGKGYAAEAAQPIIDYVFKTLRARRIVAQTEKANLASQRVMHKLGMTLLHNPTNEPFWFETLGVLNNPEYPG
jgi:[ribosomal protein S5]-alanine N-acetyltransferase